MGFFKNEYGDFREGRIFGTVASLVVSAIIGGSFMGCKGCNNVDYGAGVRTGVINKVSEKGYFWKTWEGQMALEGLVAEKSVGANLWDFSIDNQARRGENSNELVAKLQEALDSGKRVKVKYVEAGAPWPTRGETSYYIQGVEPTERIENK